MPYNGGQPPARRLYTCPASRRSPDTGPLEPAPVGLPAFAGAVHLAGASRGRVLPGRVISPERRPLIGRWHPVRPFHEGGATLAARGQVPVSISQVLLATRPLLAREGGKPWQMFFTLRRGPVETST